MNHPKILDVTASSIFYNTRLKSYPDGSCQVLACDREIFGGDGWEDRKKWRVPPKAAPTHKTEEEAQGAPSEKPAPSAANIARAARRARAKLRDIALCTPFKYFVTLTLDKDKVDRYDIAAVTRKLNNWLDNHVRRDGLAYVLVPELHKDGAIHFHGFFNDALDAVDSGTITMKGWKKPRKPRSQAVRASWLDQGGQIVYNLPSWTLGYTTAISLYGDYAAAVGYVCKYVGKGMDAADGKPAAKIGGRWFYSGGELGRPRVEFAQCDIWDVMAVPGVHHFDLPQARLSFAMICCPPTIEREAVDYGAFLVPHKAAQKAALAAHLKAHAPSLLTGPWEQLTFFGQLSTHRTPWDAPLPPRRRKKKPH